MKKIFSILLISTGIAVSACSHDKFVTVDAEEFAKIVYSDTIQLLDVRTDSEYVAGHIKNAMNIDIKTTDFLDQVKEQLTREKTVAVYCLGSVRSAKAAAQLADAGYRVINLAGGINAWKKSMGEETLEKSDKNGYLVFDGDEAPDFTITLVDGKQITLSDLRGKVVMLQFTASWCSVCRKEMPHIESEIWQPNKDNPNFILIGVDRDEPIETVQKFAEQTGVTYPLGLDPGANIYAKYAVRESGITRNVLINRDGKIIMRTRLYEPKEFAGLVQKINNELK